VLAELDLNLITLLEAVVELEVLERVEQLLARILFLH
tara:strand:+ start:19 stop:129 length:111 start_codon:yes stop_codon:yes gene_type:complete